MHAILLLAALAAGQTSSKPAPLSESQITQLRKLIQSTQATAAELQQRLAERQDKLTAVYARFDLDVDAAEQLQADIVSLQRQLLANYHNMQVKLRSIVGKERFAILKRRIDGALKTKKAKAEND